MNARSVLIRADWQLGDVGVALALSICNDATGLGLCMLATRRCGTILDAVDAVRGASGSVKYSWVTRITYALAAGVEDSSGR
ncbi:MAG TPA: hypothetical protein VFN29_03835 [Chiayiivirga sp.]|nr:hypothetical protein [Chiayiivirga sp.]